ncbi:hypothetical protein SDC9_31554 [bioreactor metagenome]|uniref:Uncharacterized protein n=1 Tax=bioreactor metagenome TaxID=1076179 RepID=A0A644V2X3_9ZZZZ|nr:hypothetical protein [Methanocorpusculum sp.]
MPCEEETAQNSLTMYNLNKRLIEAYALKNLIVNVCGIMNITKFVMSLLVLFLMMTFFVGCAYASPIITVETEQNSYYIGEEVVFSGVNTITDNVSLFIKGVNYPQTYLFTVDVLADDTWTTTFYLQDYLNLDTGTYTISASSQPSDSHIFNGDYLYATTSVTLKQPFLSASAESSVVARGNNINITGNAPGTTQLIYYIFGTNMFASSTISVNDDGSYSIEIATDTYDTGQYFVVVQHPMYDRLFNIGPVAAESGGYYIKMNVNGDYTSGDAVLLFNTLDRQSANAAQALCQAMDFQNIDDIYVKLTVIVAQPCLTMNPVSDIVKGEPLTVSGTTNLEEGTVITVDVLSIAYTAVDKTTVGSESFINLTTTVVKGADGVNTWEVTFDTTGLNADTYIIEAVTEELSTSPFIDIVWIAATPTQTAPPPFPVVITPKLILDSLTVDPEYSPSVAEGTPISVNARLIIDKNLISTSGSLKFTTALRDSTLWTVDVYKGTTGYNSTSEDALITSFSSTNFAYTISGFVLDYNEPITLVIHLTGLYPAESGNITAFKLDCDPGSGNSQAFTYSYLYGPTHHIPSFSDELELLAGWNFISVPKTLNASNNTFGSLFGNVETSNKNILAYNAQTRTWIPILNQNEIIQPLNGYWIYAANQTTITLTYPSDPASPSMKTLYPGWNAVGLSADESASAKTALAGTSWRTLLPWNLAEGKYDSAIVNGGSDANSPDRLMTPGNGYWVYVDAQSTLVGLTA